MNILLLIFGGGAEQNGKEPGQQTNQRQCKDLGDAPPKSDLVRLPPIMNPELAIGPRP